MRMTPTVTYPPQPPTLALAAALALMIGQLGLGILGTSATRFPFLTGGHDRVARRTMAAPFSQ